MASQSLEQPLGILVLPRRGDQLVQAHRQNGRGNPE